MLETYGIKQITLNLPFRLNHVNCFLAEGENGWLVIDAGLHNQETVKRWEQELAGKEVTDIIITHYHPDHFGYAGGLQKKHGARVSMTEIDANNGLTSWNKDFTKGLRTNYELLGVPSDYSEKLKENTEDFVRRVTPYPEINHYLVEGEKIVIGKYEYEVIFTPGHSDGLVTFYNKETSTLLSTDHILPHITPNISYWFHGDPNPLKTYLHSLEKIRKLDVHFVVPSHGKPFYHGNKRIDEIREHHVERLSATMDIIKEKSTVLQVCEKLFNKEFNTHDMRFAIGESLAHLEYLYQSGECKREKLNGMYYYYV